MMDNRMDNQEVARRICAYVDQNGLYEGKLEDLQNFKTIQSYIYKAGQYSVKTVGNTFFVKKRINYTAIIRKQITGPGTYVVRSGNRFIANTYMCKNWPDWNFTVKDLGDEMVEIKFLDKKDPFSDKLSRMNYQELIALQKAVQIEINKRT